MKYFTSDWHLSHNNILKFSNRPFSIIEEMDNTIINNVLSVLKPKDEIYFLGDLSWSNETSLTFFKQLPKDIQFNWITGNHDKNPYEFIKMFNFIKIFSIKEIYINNVLTTLCHYPMITWNRSHYNAYMLFGHHHQNNHGSNLIKQKTVGKMLNVNVEFNNYEMYSEQEIIEYMDKQPDNWDFIKK